MGMETNSFFVYLSAAEGLMIVCMLGWEIFWLRRMYIILNKMPTAEQLEKMINIIQGDREAIKNAVSGLANVFEPLKSMFGNLIGK